MHTVMLVLLCGICACGSTPRHEAVPAPSPIEAGADAGITGASIDAAPLLWDGTCLDNALARGCN